MGLTEEDTRIWLQLLNGKNRTSHQKRVAISIYTTSLTEESCDREYSNYLEIERTKLRAAKKIRDLQRRGGYSDLAIYCALGHEGVSKWTLKKTE